MEGNLVGDRFRLTRLVASGLMGSQLLGVTEITTALGVTKRTAIRYTKRADFPAPAERLARGPIWHRSDVEAWGKTHLPLPTGRPRKSPDE